VQSEEAAEENKSDDEEQVDEQIAELQVSNYSILVVLFFNFSIRNPV
jgi:hypothetical protein